MLGASEECLLGILVLQGVSWVSRVFKTQPPSEHHHHLCGAHLACAGLNVQLTCVSKALEQGFEGTGFEQKHVFDVVLHFAVSAQQVAQVSVEKAIVPHELKKGVHEKPSFFHVAHMGGGRQDGLEFLQVLGEQCVHELIFGGEVIVEVAWADGEFSRDQGCRDVGFSKSIEELAGGLEDSFGGSPGGFFRHGCLRRKRVEGLGLPEGLKTSPSHSNANFQKTTVGFGGSSDPLELEETRTRLQT